MSLARIFVGFYTFFLKESFKELQVGSQDFVSLREQVNHFFLELTVINRQVGFSNFVFLQRNSRESGDLDKKAAK